MVCTLPSRKTWLSSRLLDPSRDHVAYSNRTLEASLIKSLFTEMCAGLCKPRKMWKHPGSNRKSSLVLGSKKQLGNCSCRGGTLKRGSGLWERRTAIAPTL